MRSYLINVAIAFVFASLVTCRSPNIVLILNDDQDLTLGGMRPMKNAQAFLKDQGATLDNFFATTPVW